jgi:predicted alpha/beta-hydrolase family hydrolase
MKQRAHQDHMLGSPDAPPRTGVGLAAAAVAAAVAAATAAALLAGGASSGGGVATTLVDAMARAAELPVEIRSIISQFAYRAHKPPLIQLIR